jgi:hypothetical protein
VGEAVAKAGIASSTATGGGGILFNGLITMLSLGFAVEPLVNELKPQWSPDNTTIVTIGVNSVITTAASTPDIHIADYMGNTIGKAASNGGTLNPGQSHDIHVGQSSRSSSPNPSYVTINAAGDERICISYIAIQGPDNIGYTWYGDMAATCGADWYWSNTTTSTIPDSVGGAYQPACVWLDNSSKHGINTRGIGFHLESLIMNEARKKQYQENHDLLCKSKPRFAFYRDEDKMDVDSGIPFFTKQVVDPSTLLDIDNKAALDQHNWGIGNTVGVQKLGTRGRVSDGYGKTSSSGPKPVNGKIGTTTVDGSSVDCGGNQQTKPSNTTNVDTGSSTGQDDATATQLGDEDRGNGAVSDPAKATHTNTASNQVSSHQSNSTKTNNSGTGALKGIEDPTAINDATDNDQPSQPTGLSKGSATGSSTGRKVSRATKQGDAKDPAIQPKNITQPTDTTGSTGTAQHIDASNIGTGSSSHQVNTTNTNNVGVSNAADDKTLQPTGTVKAGSGSSSDQSNPKANSNAGIGSPADQKNATSTKNPNTGSSSDQSNGTGTNNAQEGDDSVDEPAQATGTATGTGTSSDQSDTTQDKSCQSSNNKDNKGQKGQTGNDQDANPHRGHLVKSNCPSHSARQLCASPGAWGPDAVSLVEMLFCDLETKQLWPICRLFNQRGCFDLAIHQIRPASRHSLRDASTGRNVPIKKYTNIHEWS